MKINWKNRITPDEITELKHNEIFTYGDNEAHRHGEGAAKTAMKWGAKYGQGGLVGRTYGIPTKDRTVKRTLSIAEIKVYVDKFLPVVKEHPELIFMITEIGCGLAGHKHKDIAPLFEAFIELENVHLPRRFWRFLVDVNDDI